MNKIGNTVTMMMKIEIVETFDYWKLFELLGAFALQTEEILYK